MKIQNNKKRILVLQKLYSLIKVSKLKSLAEIAKFNKTFLLKFNKVIQTKEILAFLEKKYQFGNIFFNGFEKNKNKGILWIYITEEHEINSFSYDTLNTKLLEKINKNKDLFIFVGNEAIKFAKKNSLNFLLQIANNKEKNIVQNLSSIIYSTFINNNVKKIKFVLNTNKVIDKIVSVLPIKNLNLKINDYKNLEFNNLKKYQFYPSLSNFSKNIIFIYLNSIVSALITESYFYKIKQKYVKQNDLLKNIEKKIELLQKNDLKNKRKELTDEILLSSQNKQQN